MIESIQDSKSEVRNLILIPHRDLHRFPLHSLFPQNFTITYLPSAKIGLTLQHLTPNPNVRLLSVEHPNSEGLDQLPFAEIESAAISQFFDNSTRLTGIDATKEQVMGSLADEHSIFHFTGHAAYEFNNPKESYLALTDKDRLTLENVLHLDLISYRLVSLVACETAITGNQTIITEYAGLVSGFLSQGVSYVLSTLWTVESGASAVIMIKFYRLLRKGIPEPVALARAQRWLRQLSCRKLAKLYEFYQDAIKRLPDDEGRLEPFLKTELRIVGRMEPSYKLYEHPYYWAAFTITGFCKEENEPHR